MKILIVEDDKDITALLTDELMQWGYETKGIHDFNAILEEISAFSPELVLMDINLPYYNGYYWTQKIRQISTVPIIFISSRTESMDIVQAMQFGADDYITKPIDIHVARAKIQAILRRTYDYLVDMNTLTFEKLTLNLSAATLEGENFTLHVTRTELLILEMLFRHKTDIARREDIINHCWQSEHFIDDNTLAVNVARLRKKLSAAGAPDLIETKKGLGYRLRGEGSHGCII